MAGLVSYASSDEDSADEQPQIQAPSLPKQTQPQPQPSQPAVATAPKPTAPAAPSPQPHAPRAPGASLPPPPSSAVLPLGPSLPPVALPSASSPSSPSPSSPYTTTRSLIHDLTLPSIPNFDIPPSPPRSRSRSPSSSSATTKKFEQFLALKKQGTHLNAKLEQSSALRNPALMDKLLDFVDILPPGRGGGGGDGQGRQREKALQYQTTLPAEVWNPGVFPEWAFRDGLRRSREKVAKERETARAAGGRSSVDFVSGTTTAAAGGGGLREKRKGGWQ
ncbi:hypothetical protein G3M48_009532 [Beauveria asiatica]|uniref:HCNGP-like protein n=1 Tax=Beauveria asiatica TaxID=1069075 RepID=A0AAW0RIW1_9HYPO